MIQMTERGESGANWLLFILLVTICLGGSVGLSHLVNSDVKHNQDQLRKEFDARLPRIEKLEHGMADISRKLDAKLNVPASEVKQSNSTEAEATRELIRSEFKSFRDSMGVNQ
jgi:hypothetical protein